MLDSSIMEYMKWMVAAISITFVVIVVVYMFRLNEVNSFQQEVNYQIERHGGLTQEALKDLNAHAKDNYGGCIVESPIDSSRCMFAGDLGDSSGFFVSEIKGATGNLKYFKRSDNIQARYGTPVKYVITRQIGNIDGVAFFKPTILGESASRVRGNSDE